MNDDLKELLASLTSQNVEFLVIGAHAVAFYGRPRYTEDLDLFVGRSSENVERLRIALEELGTPIGKVGAERFVRDSRQMIRLGNPPNMVDIQNFAGSRTFEAVYDRRVSGEIDGVVASFPSLADLIDMKRTAARPQDLVDAQSLEQGLNDN